MPPTRNNCHNCPNTDCLLQHCKSIPSEPEIDWPRKQMVFPRGKVVFKQGDPVRGIYLLQSGLVKLEAVGRRGAGVILGFRKKGAPLGLHSLRSTDPHAHTAVTVEDTHFCVIDTGHFKSLVDHCTSLREKLFESIAGEMNEFTERLLSMANLGVRARVAETLLYICELYGYRNEGRDMRIRIDREEMAMFAGTTKEQVSKALGDFKRMGLVSFRAKHFKRVDIAGLTALTGRVDAEANGFLNGGVTLPAVA
jgi:CRP-like cAMP-binding protein